jgi:hypothetical protein
MLNEVKHPARRETQTLTSLLGRYFALLSMTLKFVGGIIT